MELHGYVDGFILSFSFQFPAGIGKQLLKLKLAVVHILTRRLVPLMHLSPVVSQKSAKWPILAVRIANCLMCRLQQQLPRGARLHAQRALAPDLQRQLDARAAEQVAARRGRGGAASEQLEADRALRRDVVGVLPAHVRPQVAGAGQSRLTRGGELSWSFFAAPPPHASSGNLAFSCGANCRD